jgi:hypothetical protein
LAPSSNAHTYRLLIVKELIRCCLLYLAKRFVRQQQEKEYEAISDSRQLLFCYTAESAASRCHVNYLISLLFQPGRVGGGEL